MMPVDVKDLMQKEIKSESQTELKIDGKILIKSFDQLLDTCIKSKEIKLRYELEKNVKLDEKLENWSPIRSTKGVQNFVKFGFNFAQNT